MQFFIFVLFFCFFIFLFTLYQLSQDDFIFIRKGISVETIFNTAFSIAIISLIAARLLYIFSYPRPVFFTFLGSFLFPYFPGLSIIGCVFGGAIFLSIYSYYKKFPIGRMLDFFSVSLLSSLPFGFLFVFLLNLGNKFLLTSLVFYILFLIFTIFFLLRLSTKGKIKDGGIGLLFLIIFSIFTLVINIFIANLHFVYSLENIIIFPGLILSLALFIYKQLLGKRSY
ncbi:MAG: hypothetical protein A2152_02800 [Candidatus Levybacteria bacterium RBG_16_35_6]|nr:MAG: hypothetical protein A2152_02800 [Candidatus Levybacteria bacterium RBG_16_35_6]